MLKALVTVAATLVIVAAVNMFIVPAVHAQQGGVDLGPRINVTVENYLGQSLYAHCWSSEDDLGEHHLGDRDTFSWSFKINLFRTTKFVCNLKWKLNMEKTIAIYEAKNDKGICAELCIRDVRPDGLYVYHEYQDSWELRFQW